jgi:hypothetical protein
MLALRILRHLAVLVILAVAVLTSPPRSAAYYNFFGLCEVQGQFLTGYCVGHDPFEPRVCSRSPHLYSPCPRGAKATNPQFIRFGQFCARYVDTARRCFAYLP